MYLLRKEPKTTANIFRQAVSKQSENNTQLRIEYEKILERVRQTKESVIRMEDRRFTAPVDEIEGTVESASPGGITLKEYPGRLFQYSSVGMSAADMSARILGENNNQTRSLRPAASKNSARGRAMSRPLTLTHATLTLPSLLAAAAAR